MGLLDRIAGQCEMRILVAPWAPGLTLAFARWRGNAPILSPLAAGSGASRAVASRRALGEIAENLSLIPEGWPGPIAAHDRNDGRLLCADARARPLAGADNPGSEGCAAGECDDRARFAALCERAERAALAQWWGGGLVAQRMAVPDGAPDYRGGLRARRDRLFALPFLPGLTICLAISDDGAGGQLSLGSAAAPSPDQAADAALREAMQAEIAWLSPAHHPDVPARDHMHRGLHMRLPALLAAPLTRETGRDATLDSLLDTLTRSGVSHGFADLTHPVWGIPVWRFVCPVWPRARPLLTAEAAGCADARLTQGAAG